MQPATAVTTARASVLAPRAGPAAAATPARVLRRHWPIAVLAALGAGVRVLAAYSYWPAVMFYGDSYSYLRAARAASPPVDRPFGYPALLRLLSWVDSLAVVPIVQHLTGVALGVGIYTLLVRRAAPRWAATAAAAPVLLGGYQIAIEQQVLSETLFDALVFASVVVALAVRTPRRAAGLGVLLAAAAVTRTTGVVVIPVALGYLVLRTRSWRVTGAAAVAAGLALGGYAGWYAAAHREVTLQSESGHFLYGRVAPFADCAGLRLDPLEQRLCPAEPVGQRPGPNWFDWSPTTPYARLGVPPAQANAVAGRFARQVIMHQPLDYAGVVARDVAHYFAPGRRDWPTDEPNAVWRFPAEAVSPAAEHAVAQYDAAGHYAAPHFSPAGARVLRAYQSVAYAYGPLLGVLAAVGVGGAVVGRRRGRQRRWDSAFVTAAGLALIVVPSATAMFSYRYALPAVLLLPLGAGLALTRAGAPVALPRQRSRSGRRSGVGAATGAAVFALAVGLVAAAPLSPAPIFDTWSLRHQAEFGSLGPMTGPARPAAGVPGGVEQPFARGTLVARPARGAGRPHVGLGPP